MPFVRRQRKYYKYQDWTQPVLTENGTMGGDKFAVGASSILNSDNPTWGAFTGDDFVGQWHSASGFPQWIAWYNPNPLKISNVRVVNRKKDGSYPDAYQLQYSDNNSTWITAVSGNGTSGDSVSWNIPVTHDTAHKYWRLYVTSASGSNNSYVAIGEIDITAQEPVEVPSSSITDFGSYKYYKNIVTTKYWKEITTGSRELEYACYSNNGSYVYATKDLKIVKVLELNMQKVTDSNNLTMDVTSFCRNITIDSLEYNFAAITGGSYWYKFPRSYNDDLYIDTTVTETVEGTPEDYTYTTEEIVPVEVTADEDYDYTEFVPSTQFDNYEDKNSFYNITKRHRTYYKYGTELDATVVGSPTIVDGVVGGFTTANYLLTTKNFTTASNTWEAVAKITTGSNVNTLQFIFGNGGVSWRMSICVTGGHFAANLSSNNSSWNISSTSGKYTVLANTNYWVKLKFTGTQYVLEYSVDGNVWNEDLVIDNSTPIYNSDLPLSVGANKHRDGVNYPFLGSIDLLKSYIKINGKDWWHGTKAIELNVGGEDVYNDWTQPVLTSDTDQNCIVTCSAAYSGYPAYYAMDNSTTNCWFPNTKTGWWQIKLPKKILITGLTHIAGAYSQQTQGITGRYYTSSGKTTPIGDEISGTYVQGAAVNISNIPAEGILTDTIYFEKTGGSVTHENSGIGQLLITAKELKAIGGTVEDADYYISHNKFYQLVAKKRSYYKYDYKDWTQPILTANGTLGENSFAVGSNVTQLSPNDVYKLFDNNTTTFFHSVQGAVTGYIDIYNPNPLNITNILVNNQNAGSSQNRASTAGNIYGSDNGSDWELITSYTNTVQGINAQWNIDLSSNNKYYKYYRLESTACGSGGYWTIGELTLTAQEKFGVESSAEDADYYIDTNKMY